MVIAYIYQPAKNVMQSGVAKTKKWVLELNSEDPNSMDWYDVIGWVSSTDTEAQQVRIYFSSQEQAIAFSNKKGISYILKNPEQRKIIPKSYASNFIREKKE